MPKDRTLKPDSRFTKKDKAFWGCVRSLSQDLGYTVRGEDRIKVPSFLEMREGFVDLELDPDAISDRSGKPTQLGIELDEYFKYRAEILDRTAAANLMDFEEAKALFQQHFAKLKPPNTMLPMNKQKGDKSGPMLLTGLINMLIHHHSGGADCDYDPRKLTTITKDKVPLRTLARRVDGAFPRSVNPVAIWEIKEYYHTTTFGSRIADGVYESLLDGLELEELRDSKGVDIKHYLFIDSRRTWWGMGKAYLCRIVDMLNMGYVDEVLFGREVVAEMPRLVKEWLTLIKVEQNRGTADPAARA